MHTATSATVSRPSRRTARRVAVGVSGLAAALALTACSGGGGSDEEPDAGPTSSASAGTGGTGGSASAPTAGKLEGSWLATTDGKSVALVVTGRQAALFTTGGSMCSGTAGKEAGMRMIHLTCADGGKDRATGMVDSVGGTTLKVTWEGGLGTEKYTRAEGGTLPSGLPTGGLGS